MENNTKIFDLFKNAKLNNATTTPEERKAAILARFHELVQKLREQQKQNKETQE